MINRDSPVAEIQDQRLLEIEMLLQIVRSPVAVHFGKYFLYLGVAISERAVR